MCVLMAGICHAKRTEPTKRECSHVNEREDVMNECLYEEQKTNLTFLNISCSVSFLRFCGFFRHGGNPHTTAGS